MKILSIFNNKYRNRIENKITELDKKCIFLTFRLETTSHLLPTDRVKLIVEREKYKDYIKLLRELL